MYRILYRVMLYYSSCNRILFIIIQLSYFVIITCVIRYNIIYGKNLFERTKYLVKYDRVRIPVEVVRVLFELTSFLINKNFVNLNRIWITGILFVFYQIFG